MGRSSLLIVLLLLAVGLYYAFQDLRRSHEEASSPEAERSIDQSTQTALPVSTPATAASVSTPNLVRDFAIKSKQDEIQNLQIQISQEEQNLQQRAQILNTLKAQKSEQDQQSNLGYASQVRIRNLEIQNLADDLQTQRLAENDISQATATALRDQSSAAQVAYQQIDQNIQATETAIQQTQEQIHYWQQSLVNITEQQSQLEQLQITLANLRQQLNDLKLQRLNIASQVLARNRSIEAQSQAQKTNLIENESAIQARISDLRNELRQLQDSRDRRQLSSVSLDEQIRQSQSAVDQQMQKIKNLESSLQTRQEELRQIQ
jgi:predicted  nucleic acid-binding Zn-ribbon protein